MTSGIYKIAVGDRFYFGSSVEIEKRWMYHRRDLRGGRHSNVIMQRCWDKYGEAAFTFEVVDTCPPEETLEVEQLYLDLVIGVPGCMNLAKTATAVMAGRKHAEESKAKIIASLQGNTYAGREVGAFIDGDLVNSCPSAGRCGKELGLSPTTVQKWCNGKLPQPGQGKFCKGVVKHLATYSPGIEFHYLDK